MCVCVCVCVCGCVCVGVCVWGCVCVCVFPFRVTDQRTAAFATDTNPLVPEDITLKNII